jgi:hypothetical protein
MSRQLPFVSGMVMLVFVTVLLAVGQSVFILTIAKFLQGASNGFI